MSLRIETCLCCQADIWHFKNCQQASFVCMLCCAHIYHTATLLYNPSTVKVTPALTGWRKKQVFLYLKMHSVSQMTLKRKLKIYILDCSLVCRPIYYLLYIEIVGCYYQTIVDVKTLQCCFFFPHLKRVNTVKHSHTALIFILNEKFYFIASLWYFLYNLLLNNHTNIVYHSENKKMCSFHKSINSLFQLNTNIWQPVSLGLYYFLLGTLGTQSTMKLYFSSHHLVSP